MIDYQLPYPKHEFLSYLVERERVLLHGSSHPDLGTLEPRSQDTWQGENVTGVFAASDGIWPLFFAILRSDGEPRSLRNACVSVPTRSGTRRHYFFGVDEATMRRGPWDDGFVYIVPRKTFARVTPHGLFREEWVSAEPVRPLAPLSVSPDDLPFLDSIIAFPRDETPARTWLRLAPPPLGGSSATRG